MLSNRRMRDTSATYSEPFRTATPFGMSRPVAIVITLSAFWSLLASTTA